MELYGRMYYDGRLEYAVTLSGAILLLRTWWLQDYHVIFLQENGTTVLVYDLDSTIKFPCEIRRYWRKTMRMDIPLEGQYKR